MVRFGGEDGEYVARYLEDGGNGRGQPPQQGVVREVPLNTNPFSAFFQTLLPWSRVVEAREQEPSNDNDDTNEQYTLFNYY